MDATHTPEQDISSVRWQSVGLPSEHGGWSFIGEPLLLGLLLVPSWGGLALGMAAYAIFLLRQPLKVLMTDYRKRRVTPRGLLARRFALGYALAIAAASVGVLLNLTDHLPLIPLVVAAPLLHIQLRYDMAGKSREAIAELSSALAATTIAPSLVLMNGWGLSDALLLWVVMTAKAVSAVLYVRARLRLERNKPAALSAAYATHALALGALLLLAWLDAVPYSAAVGMGLLSARAVWGLSRWRTPQPPKVIGVQEVVFGISYVLLAAWGYSNVG